MKNLRTIFILFIALALAACANIAPITTPLPSTATIFPPTQKIAPTNTRAQNTATALRSTATTIPVTDTLASPTRTPTSAATAMPATRTPIPIAGLPGETLADWETFVASLASGADAQARVNDFWNTVTQARRVPLVLNDAVIFLYKGDAASVLWRGDFSFWQLGKGIDGTRVGETDLWYGVAKFPRDSRTEYEILLNGTQAINDPANPRKHKSAFGYNSILAMPEFQVTDFSKRRANVPQGTLTDWTRIESQAWGAPLNYRVYTPPNYESLENLPVVYITDGNDFSDPKMSGTPAIIDNLIAAEKISPLIAVFIDARNPNNLRDNQREKQFLARPEDFAAFIATELVPHIDATYHTDASRSGRTLMGVSYGGAFTTYAGLRYQDVFGRLAIFSPAYWVYQSQVAAGAPRMSAFVNKALETRGGAPLKIFLSGGVPGWDVGDLKPMAERFRKHGDAVEIFHSQEGHSWSAWSGLTDEMLEYLFGE